MQGKFRATALLAVLLAVIALLWFYMDVPPITARKQIFRGVYLTVEGRSPEEASSGRLMMVEVHWDVPGVRLANREFSYSVSETDWSSPHYRLVNADWALMRSGASVLVNTTLYHPNSYYRSLPGFPVRSLETIVVDGSPSHIDPRSYLLYWDAGMTAHILRHKPPDRESLLRAVLGLGLQGIQVDNGEPRYAALGNLDEVTPRTFIGVDPNRRILYLMAFGSASGTEMIQQAVKAGVVVGGQLDSGGASTLLIGRAADGIRGHTGIRHWRPLGSYLTVVAEPLN